MLDFGLSAEDILPADTIQASKITATVPKVGPSVWTYNDCVDWVLENNTDLRRTLVNILSARQDYLSAKDAWLPTVGFSTNQSYTNYPNPETGRRGNTYGSSYNIGANWTVWDGNVRKYKAESARYMELQQSLAGDDVIKSLRLGILEAYINIMYARDAVAIARQTLEVSTYQAARAEKLAASGRISQVDYAQIESQRAQDSYNLTQAEGNLETAKLALKKILTLGLDYRLEVQDVTFSDEEVVAPLPNSSEVFDLAAAWLPMIRSNNLSKSIYANDVRIAKAGMLPSIALQGGLGTGYTSGESSNWGSTMGHNFNENVGVTINVPIYDANSTKRAVAKARLEEMNAELETTSLLNDLSQTIESLYIDASNAQAKFESGLSRLNAMKQTDDLVNRQFELGLVNPLDLLTAHNNLLNARLELLQSKYMAILAAKTIHYYATQEVTL